MSSPSPTPECHSAVSTAARSASTAEDTAEGVFPADSQDNTPVCPADLVGQVEQGGGAGERQLSGRGSSAQVPRPASQSTRMSTMAVVLQGWGLLCSCCSYSFWGRWPGSAHHPERMSGEDTESLERPLAPQLAPEGLRSLLLKMWYLDPGNQNQICI